jgi:hypothetical protein
MAVETQNVRAAWAAIGAAAGEGSSNRFLQVAASALQSEVLIRLIRILDNNKGASSLWYLYRCEPARVARGVDIKKLKSFSERLKKIRDKVFVHIDQHAVFDPQAIYRDANITAWRLLRALRQSVKA